MKLTATKEINAALKTPGLTAVALKAGAEDAWAVRSNNSGSSAALAHA